jgi:hypothetical protein
VYRLDPQKDEKQIEALKAQTPDGKLREFSATVEGKEYIVYVRRPSRAEYKDFRAAASNDKKQAAALETLLCTCVVYPSGAAFQAMLDEAPGLSETFGEELLKIAGLAVSADSKKL